MLRLAFALGISYLCGSLPTAYLLAKWVKGVDIRTVGSGNVGATNALRTLGPWAGAVVLLVDTLKGMLAAGVIPRWVLVSVTSESALGCGLAAVLGHAFPCFLRFRGGKGVATTMGVLAVQHPWLAVMVLGVWLIVFVIGRYVSLASIGAAATIPIGQLLRGRSLVEVTLGACVAVLILTRHRPNMQRLFSGTEHRAWSR